MGWIRKLDSGRYQGAYRDRAERVHRLTFDKRRDAQAWVGRNEEAMRRGAWIDPRHARMTVAQVAELWLAAGGRGVDTERHHDKAWRLHIEPAFGGLRIGDVERRDVQRWADHLAVTHAPASVRTYLSYLRALFAVAVDDGLRATNPASRVKVRDDGTEPIQPLEPDAVAALLEALAPRYRIAVVLGAGAGLRSGEVRGLGVDRVDWLGRSLRVNRQLGYVPSARRAEGEPCYALRAPKTKASRRTVPVGAELIDALAAHLEAFGAGPDGLVLTNARGGPVGQPSFSAAWTRAVRAVLGARAQLDFHQLRHFYASSLIGAGENPKVIQERMGHRSITVTFDTYGHLWPADDDRTRTISDAIVAGLGAPSLSVVKFPRALRARGPRVVGLHQP